MLVLIAKFGISSAFNILFVSHQQVFPVLFSATALGILNFTTRIFTGVSPILARMEEPTPVMVFFITSILGLIIVWGIQVQKQVKSEQDEINGETYVKPLDTS